MDRHGQPLLTQAHHIMHDVERRMAVMTQDLQHV